MNKRININIDTNLLKEIDRAAKKKGMSRSSFFAEGAKRILPDAVQYTGRLRWLITKPKVDTESGLMVSKPQTLQQEAIIQGRNKDRVVWKDVPMARERE